LADHADLVHKLEIAVESNDKYRSRARAVSTLCAAAAGALAAGLILAPTEAVPQQAQVLGLIAIVLLIGATALSLAASSASSYQAGEKRAARILHGLEVWRIRTSPRQDPYIPPTYEDLIADAGHVKNGIGRTLSLGLWSAAFAAVALVAALTLATFSGESGRVVTLELEKSPEIATCPGIGPTFKGQIRDQDRLSSVGLLPVFVSPDECGNSTGVTIYLEKSRVAIVSSR
jgi:hypothetical protein